MKGVVEEANMTVVTIILIGVIVAIATPIITGMMNNTKARTECMNNGQCWNSDSNTCGPCGTI